MNKGLDLFKHCSAFALHYNSKVDYDCVKYNFKTKTSIESFNRSNLKWQYIGVAKKLAEFDTRFILYMVYSLDDVTYRSPIKVLKTALTVPKTKEEFYEKIFKKDLLYLKQEYNDPQDIFNVDGLYPNLYKEYKNGKININTLSLLSAFIVDKMKPEFSRDIIAWPSFIKKIDNDRQMVKYFFDQNVVSNYFSKYVLSPGV
jgi:hypothetical protein